MSRIDEALSRQGKSRDESRPPGAAEADVFMSPWRSGLPVDHPAPHRGSGAHPRIVSSESLARLGSERRARLTLFTDVEPVMAHQFRRLAAILMKAQGQERLKSVLITSASPHDGKTLTSLNLAGVLSKSYGLRVLLVEADLRRPGIAAALDLRPREGLSAALKAGEDRKVPLIELSDTLTLLPAGRPDLDPLSGLTSPRMKRILDDATEAFDWVILDTPPLGAAADAGLLCPLVDAAILVIRARQTACAAVQAAVETLGRERIIGVVLNGVDQAPSAAYDGGYGYAG
jgi:capsular exopolysaccharide synthesis family protein